MKYGLQYPATKFTRRSLSLLLTHPGLTATEFAALYWPNLKVPLSGKHSTMRKPGMLGAMRLSKLVKHKLILGRFEPPYWKPGPVQPEKRYYLTEKGFAVHQSYARQNSHAPYCH